MSEHGVTDHTPAPGRMRRFGTIRRSGGSQGVDPSDVSNEGELMLQRVRTRWAAGLAVAAVTGAVIVPTVDGASSKTVNTTVKVKGLPNFTGTVSGKPYGSGKVKGKIDLPNLTATLTYKGGSVRIRGTVSDASPIKGTWRTTGGTGKYRNVKGSGSFSGSFSGTAATLKFRGKIKP